jgi:hypothetical protein
MKLIKNIYSVFSPLLLILFMYSCSKQKDLKVLGFAYRGENIVISEKGKAFLNSNINGNEDVQRICSFSYSIKVPLSGENDLMLRIVLDSSTIMLLDTIVDIPKTCKEPFISFIYPSMENNYKRLLFVADGTDNSYIKY